MGKDVLDFICSFLVHSCPCWDRSVMWWGICPDTWTPAFPMLQEVTFVSFHGLLVLQAVLSLVEVAMVLLLPSELLHRCPAAHGATLKAAESTQSPELTLGRVEKPQLCV